MSERYSRLFALTEDLYGEGAPVVIAAGALLKDNQNGKVLAQLKFRSLSGKRIKALTVALTPKDVAGAELEQVTHRYLDLDAGRDAEFCQKMPVFLPNAETRSFGAAVTQVVFADGSVWETENLHWEPLLKPESAAKVGDAELAKQYRMEYGSYLMQEHKDLWFCSCGAVNRLGVDTTCHSCRKALADLQSISWEELEEHKQARLAEEEKARLAAEAEAEKNRAAAEARAKKMKKLAPIVLPILAVVIVAAVLITGAVKKKAVYEDAMTMVDQGQYGKAVTILKEAGYDDAADLVFGPIYQEAEALMEAGDYEAAAAAYKKISVYLDSHARAAEAAELAREAAAQPLYKEAEALLAQGETARAAMAFYAVGDYQDARKRSFELWSSLRHNPTVATGLSGTAAVTEDGKVLYWGDIEYPEEKQIMISADQWSDIESLSAGGFHLVGLRADGTGGCRRR